MSPVERFDAVMVDNTSGAPTCPSWLLLLDDPAPRRVVLVGPPDDGTVAWFAGVGVTVERRTRPEDHRASEQPVDLLVLSSDVRVGRNRRGTTDLLDRSLRAVKPDAVVVGPTVTGRASSGVLERHGFGSVRPIVSAAADRSHRKSGGFVAMRSPRSDGVPESSPPRWLVDLAGDAPWAPRHGGWSLRVPEAYPSQKAVVVCRPTAAGEPTAIIKVTRHTRFNARLDNEARSLRGLATSAPAAARRAPAVLTDGRVAGLSFVAETAVAGRPFPQASRFGPNCPLADDAVTAIGDLARSGGRAVPGRPLAERLDALLEQYVDRFRATPEVRVFLDRQIRLIDGSEVPEVVFHGDLGTWNLLVDDRTVRILDWESAEDPGPPVWDLAYFSRSFAVRAGRRRGLRRDRAIGRHLLDTSEINAAIAAWFHRYTERVGLDPCLVEPLFHTTWMHRALKEANRLAPGADGHYGPLCARFVIERDAPGLRRILAR